MFKKLNSLLLTALLVCCLLQCGCTAKEASLTVLYTNDVHGQLLPLKEYTDPEAASLGATEDVGGVCRRAAYMESVRKYTKHAVLALDAGDIFTRGPAERLEGKPDIALMNLMKYNAAAVGNNEFKGDGWKGNPTPASMDILAQRQKEAHFPFLCANVYRDGQRAFEPYIIKEAEGLRIGIFGVTASSSASYKSTRDYQFTDPVDEAGKVIDELKDKADLIICLSHAGIIDDVVMAGKYKDIALIVGGHTHTWLPVPLFSSAGRPVKDKNVNGVIVCSDGEYGVAVGRIDLKLAEQDDGSWKVSKYSASLVPMTSKYKDHPGAKALLEQYWKPLGLIK